MVGIIVIPILPMKKLRYKEVKQFVQGHMARQSRAKTQAVRFQQCNLLAPTRHCLSYLA